ncbi:MAG: hypothetical protein ACE15C_08335 [Phycisphaerae bacterium]
MVEGVVSIDQGTVDRNLWENELELSIDDTLLRAQNPEEMRAWVLSRTGRQVGVLCRALGITDATRLKDQKSALAQCNGRLVPFYLVDLFACRKGEYATLDLAQARLSEDVIKPCLCGDEESCDKKALLYALYHDNPDHLKTLFHLDKIHKSSFARMVLRQKVRQPEQKFVDFLTTERAKEVLEAFDRQKRDRRRSQLKDIIRHNHHHLVFVRRPERPQYIMVPGDRIQHGHRVEWVILDFADDANRVAIASDSRDAPLQMANMLASAYFGRDVQYVDECQITYAKQIANLLAQLKQGKCEGLDLVELSVSNSAVDGVDLHLSHDAPDILRRAVASIERDHSSLTAKIDRIQKVEVIYRNKRIELRFDPQAAADEFIVRYVDSRLKNASLRRRFEDFMRETHGIPILTAQTRAAA